MSDSDSRLRSVFAVLYNDGVEFAIWVDMVESRTLTGMFDDAVAGLNAQHDDPADHIHCPAADCDIYSWEFERLPVGTTVAQVPEPGVVFAVRSGQEEDFGGNIMGMRLGMRSFLTNDETYGPRLRRFLRSPDATREAAPLLRYDAFVSYSARDGLFAASLLGELRRRGAECFLAEISLSAGRLWADELRAALMSSRAGLILLTPQSVHSAWIQAEVGAMWALRRPVLPVLLSLKPEDVPSSMAEFLKKAVVAPETEDAEPTLASALAARLAPILLDIRDSGDLT
jgi:hypothetical protein